MSNGGRPDRSGSQGNEVEVEVVPRGPADATLDDQARDLVQHPSVRRQLEGTRHRLLSYELVDEGKDAGLTEPPNRYKATVYDYSNNRALMVEGVIDGDEPVALSEYGSQPLPSSEEFNEAVELLRGDPELGQAIADGRARLYRPMPPLIEAELADGSVERTLTVGLLPQDGSGFRHEIVGVNMISQSVIRFDQGAPESSVAQVTVCGPPTAGQPTAIRGTAGQYLVTVTQGSTELWRFLAIRPVASSGTNGSGIELRDVDYRGKRVLYQAHVPILNVRYDDDVCGPFRDWQWEESRIQADGTDVAPGFRRSPSPVQTILESGQDGGNFLGVGLYTEGEETVLVSELEAGWYRYISEWRLANDGTIRPRFGFSAVDSSCTCERHHHHAYWRFDFDIGTSANNRVREFNDPPLPDRDDNWHTLRFETRRGRNASRNRKWAVVNTSAGDSYELIPGPEDGERDSFGVGDLWALRYVASEIDDGQGFTTDPDLARAGLDRFVNRRARMDDHDVVVWYVAHFSHDASHGGGGHVVGPELRPVNW